MASPFFSGRIPQELHDRVDQHIKESGEGKTQILINALSQYLGVEISKPKSSGVNADFFSELESLKERVSLLERSQQDSQNKQLSLLSDNSTNDNNMITHDNNIMILTSKEVADLTGIPRRTFEDRYRAGKLPMSKNGYTVIDHVGKQTEKPFANLWKVQTDNS
ncbi:MAG: hypothetical protein ACEQSC_00320 [Candidatus Nanopelagicaceae bacterium]